MTNKTKRKRHFEDESTETLQRWLQHTSGSAAFDLVNRELQEELALRRGKREEEVGREDPDSAPEA